MHVGGVLRELVAREDGVVGGLRDLVGAQLGDELVLPGVAVLGVVDDLAAHTAVVDHLVDDVGAVDALADAGDAVAFEGGAQLLEQIDLRAFAELVRRFLLELALQVLQLALQLLLVLERLGALGEDGGVLLPLQVLGLALQAHLNLGDALRDSRLLRRLQGCDLALRGGARLLHLGKLGLELGEPGRRRRLGRELGFRTCRLDLLLGCGDRLGAPACSTRPDTARAAWSRSGARRPARSAARTGTVVAHGMHVRLCRLAVGRLEE